jgi:TRAP transporter TAXI family solute receptor
MVKNHWFLRTAVLLLISFTTLFFAMGCGSQETAGGKIGAKQDPVPVYTPGSGGAAYILGGGIASIANKYIPGLNLVAEASTGSLGIVQLIDDRNKQGKSAFAVIASDGVYNGYNGQKEFTQPYPCLRAISFLYGAELYLVVPGKSSIKSYADLKGKRIGVGAPGSTVAALASLIIEKSGVSKDQYKALPLGYQEVVQGIKDGSIDGGFLAGAVPVAAYNELCSSHDVRIIPVDEAVAQDIVKNNPYYYQTKVKAGAYKGIDSDIPVLAFGVLILTHDKTSDDIVYDLIKTLMVKHEELVAVHKTAEQMNPATVLTSIGIPLHPGAEKYYKEAGILKN